MLYWQYLLSFKILFISVIFSHNKMSVAAKMGARVRKKPVIKIIHNPLFKAIVK